MVRAYTSFSNLLLLMLLLGFSSCQEEDCCLLPAGNRVDIVLLDHYVLRPYSFSEIEAGLPAREPFVPYEEIRSYDPQRYTFELHPAALSRIRQITEPTAYAVMVDDQPIYMGFFWPSFISASCDCLRFDPLATGDQLQVELGYASPRNLTHLDRRNDERLLATLQKDGKLE